MKTRLLVTLTIFSTFMLSITSCGKKQTETDGGRVTWDQVIKEDGGITRTNPKTGVTWTVVDIRTDKGDHSRALQNAEDALSAHPDLVGMIGLWEYNPPQILTAVKSRKLEGKVKIVGFDENAETLRAISNGEIVGTIVQDPYQFGFRSVQYLAAKARGQAIEAPEDGLIFIPTRSITRDTVEEFSAQARQMLEGNGSLPDGFDAAQYDTTKRVKLAFITNMQADFWDFAEQGSQLAGKQLNAEVKFIPPTEADKTAQQKREVEDLISKNFDGIALSVREPDGQVRMINNACEHLAVITVDSDAPDSKRLFYIGTDNVQAGREAGKLLAQACPQGGKVMIFVGSLTQANGHERAQGVIDELFGQ